MVEVDIEAVRAFTRAEFSGLDAVTRSSLEDFEARTVALVLHHLDAQAKEHGAASAAWLEKAQRKYDDQESQLALAKAFMITAKVAAGLASDADDMLAGRIISDLRIRAEYASRAKERLDVAARLMAADLATGSGMSLPDDPMRAVRYAAALMTANEAFDAKGEKSCEDSAYETSKKFYPPPVPR